MLAQVWLRTKDVGKSLAGKRHLTAMTIDAAITAWCPVLWFMTQGAQCLCWWPGVKRPIRF